jgi:hypothetical protein
MKLFKLFFLFLIISFSSCEKEFEYPSDTYPTFEAETSQPNISLWGEFKLLNAVMYVKNNETNANIGGYNCKYWTELTMQKIVEY